MAFVVPLINVNDKQLLTLIKMEEHFKFLLWHTVSSLKLKP